MAEQYLYKRMAALLDARKNYIDSNNQEWLQSHTKKLESLLDNLPGSGLDYTWYYDYDKCARNQIVLSMSYHAMNANGYYDRIINSTVIITPDMLFDFNLSITGNFGKYQDDKDYLYQIINDSLFQKIEV